MATSFSIENKRNDRQEVISFSSNRSSLSESVSVNSLQSVGTESLPGSFCDTDAALFLDYEMFEDEDDDQDDDDGHSSGIIRPKKRQILKNSNADRRCFKDVEKFHDESSCDGYKTELILFGIDLSHLDASLQFIISASGVLFFNMIYGYLQELIQITIAGRGFALFLGACQFLGYAFWSYVLAKLRARSLRLRKTSGRGDSKNLYAPLSIKEDDEKNNEFHNGYNRFNADLQPPFRNDAKKNVVPRGSYLALSIIRAIDLGLTNLSMKYLNYPAKTLIKSSRVIFTMMMGICIGRKKYKRSDYAMVTMLVLGLSLFLHAEMHTSAIFHPFGVAMLATSLTLDATVSNWSELIMKQENMGQDDFQMKLYSMSCILMVAASHYSGELGSGFKFFFLSDGTFNEFVAMETGANEYTSTWTSQKKAVAIFLFSTLGIFGGSCAAAITKRFGALTMSITTTTRKAGTIFLSFVMFKNECSIEHILGVIIFVLGLFLKAARNYIVMPRICIPKNLLPASIRR